MEPLPIDDGAPLPAARPHQPRRARGPVRPGMRPRRDPPRVALVLGGGGLKGFAHVGVLRALEARGIRPSLYAGTSIGALIGAAAAAGAPADDLAQRAARLSRRHLFQLNHYAMLVGRLRAPSLYAPEPLRALIAQVLPEGTFETWRTPLLVNTVDVARGTQVVWGLPGLRAASVRDAVYASCALPGMFPPGRVGGRVCVDGGTVDNLPLAPAALGALGPPPDAIIAVDVGNVAFEHEAEIAAQGFAAVFMRSASVMMHALQGAALAHWQGPPVLLVRPRVGHIGWFAFGRAAELVDAGYAAACEALAEWDAVRAAPGGIYPRRAVRVTVDPARCTGCGLCAALAPGVMALDGRGTAYAVRRDLAWSPADGGFVAQCPTAAIRVTPLAVPAAALAATAPPVARPKAEWPAAIHGAVGSAKPSTG